MAEMGKHGYTWLKKGFVGYKWEGMAKKANMVKNVDTQYWSFNFFPISL